METDIPATFGQGRFTIERELGRGGMGVVYEAFDKERDMSVALKTLINMNPNSLYYFKREFRALHDIVHPNLCSLMELIKDEKSWFLTMELIHGVDFLSHVKASDSRFDEERLRKSLAGLCSGLNALHAAGKVHRDIKPTNVMITDDDRVVLLDFGLITEKEIQGQADLGGIIGTAAYMAPEQVETSIASPAADWYSVGVMLFEVLTGKLPFDGQPAKIILEKQISDPIRPGDVEPNLPNDLENICFKLLSRDPKSRPNPAGFLDLLDAYSATGSHHFATNVTEYTQGEIFVGRNQELKLLKESFQKVVEGSFETVIIEGVSGVGKSALVNKFSSELLPIDDSVVLLNGRCYEHESAPFKAFDGIVESMLRYFRDISADKILALKPQHPELLVRLFPGFRRNDFFERITRRELEIEDPHELQRLSFEAFGEVFFQLARQHPLVVIIDDMQWVDPDSLALLKHLVSEEYASNILLTILSRYTKGSAKSAWDWDNVVNENSARLHLSPLNMSESTELTRMYIARAPESVNVVPELVAAEADGHPMYIGELVRHIAAHTGNEWTSLRLDEAIWQRACQLPENAIQILKIVCVAGAPMNREHIRYLNQVQSEEFQRCISLLRAERFVKSSKAGSSHFIEPYHDRVRESVLQKVKQSGDAEKINLEIGRFYLENFSDDDLGDNIFTVVRHWQAGEALISSESEKSILANLYFRAGMKAKDSTAFDTAIYYFDHGREFFPPDFGQTKNDTAFQLHLALAECLYFVGDQQRANEIFDLLLDRSKDKIDRALVYRIKIMLLITVARYEEAIQQGIDALHMFGVKMTPKPSKFQILKQIIRLKWFMRNKNIADLSKLPPLVDAEKLALTKVGVAMSAAAFFLNMNISAFLCLFMMNIAVRMGNSNDSPWGYSTLGLILFLGMNDFDSAVKYSELGLELSRNMVGKDAAQAVWCYAWTISHWKNHAKNSLPLYREAYRRSMEMGNLSYACHAVNNLGDYAFVLDNNLDEAYEEYFQYQDFIKRMKDPFINGSYNDNIRVYLALKGETDSLGTMNKEDAYEDRRQQEIYAINNPIDLSLHLLVKMKLRFLSGDYGDALEFAVKLDKNKEVIAACIHLPEYYFYYSLVLTALYPIVGLTQRVSFQKRLAKHQRAMKKWAIRCPENFLHKYLLVEAEKLRNKEKPKKAIETYKKAIKSAAESGYNNNCATAHELLGDYYLSLESKSATKHLLRAQDLFSQWGATAKAEDIERKIKSIRRLYQETWT